MAGKASYEELEQRLNKLEGEASARRQAEEGAKRAEEEKRAILDSLLEHVVHQDTDMNVLWANQAACNSLGITREDLIGRRCYEVWGGRDSTCEGCPVAKARDTGKPQTVEKMTPDGRWWYIQGYPVRDDSGDIVGMSELTLDITERKRAEEMLRKAHDELEMRVKERTAKLSRANVQLRWEMAERKQAEAALRQREAALETRTRELEEVNNALRLLMKRMQEDKTALEKNVSSNVKGLVSPYAQKLRKTGLRANQMAYLNILESNLNDITSPFAHKLSSKYSRLTPTEIQIAHLVKDGQTTKQIAELLNLSLRTIESHRQNIRMKVGVKNRKANLRSLLLSMRDD